MEFVSVKCSCCGAHIKVDPDARHIKCEYCGHELLIKKEKAAPPPPPENETVNVFTDVFNTVSPAYYTVARNVKKTAIIVAAISVAVGLASFFIIYFSVMNFVDGFSDPGSSYVDPGGSTDTDVKVFKTAGTYKVGTDIPAGDYILYPTSTLGSVTVTLTSNASVGSSDFVSIENFYGRKYLRAESGQYIKLTLCKMYKPADAQAVKKDANNDYPRGQYIVGTDIPAGEYALSLDSSSTLGSITVTKTPYAKPGTPNFVLIKNFYGQDYVTLSAGQYAELSGGKMREYVSTPGGKDDDNDTSGDEDITDKVFKTAGTYKADTDIPAGDYILYPVSSMGTVTVTLTPNASPGSTDFVSIENFYGRKYLRVAANQYVKLSSCKMYKPADAQTVTKGEDNGYIAGQYIVGTDIAAGEYKLVPDPASSFGSITVTKTPYAKPGTSDFVLIKNFYGQEYATLSNGQYVEMTRGKMYELAEAPKA